MGYFFGYREYDRRKYVDQQAVNLLFPFGHGISFSTFEYSNVSHGCRAAPVTKDAIFEVTVDIKNTSTVNGRRGRDALRQTAGKSRKGSPASARGRRLKSFAQGLGPCGADGQAKLHQHPRSPPLGGGTNGKWVIDSGDVHAHGRQGQRRRRNVDQQDCPAGQWRLSG